MAKVALITQYGSNFTQIGDICNRNRTKYCNLHKYDYLPRIIESKHYCYDKFNYVFEVMYNDYDYIWWTDTDGLITNNSIKVENYMDGKKDFVISKDVNGYNDGSFIIRNSELTKSFIGFLLSVKSSYINNPMQAQVAIEENENLFLDTTIQLVKQNDINAYLYELYSLDYHRLKHPENKNLGQWDENCWFLHFPGTTSQQRINLMTKYEKN